MTRKEQLFLSGSFTFVTLALVVIKLIKWYTHDVFNFWVIVDPFQFILACPLFATYAVAVFGIITFWLPPKPKFVFGIVALSVSGVFLFCELGADILIGVVGLFDVKPNKYVGLDPVFSILIIALTAIAMAMGKKQMSASERTDK